MEEDNLPPSERWETIESRRDRDLGFKLQDEISENTNITNLKEQATTTQLDLSSLYQTAAQAQANMARAEGIHQAINDRIDALSHRYDEFEESDLVGPPGLPGRDGINGTDGVGVLSVSINQAGHLLVNRTDGSHLDAGYVVGPKGDPGINGTNGRDGTNGVDGRNGIDGQNGSDGAPGPRGFPGDKGDRGDRGPSGPDGKDGVGITGVTVNPSGYLIISKSDGSTIDAGLVKGADGQPGRDGTNGTNGAPGAPGTNGINGVGISTVVIDQLGRLMVTKTDGTTVNAGIAKGSDGSPGTNGAPGTNGTNGIDGVSVSSATVNGSGQLILTLSSGSTINAGVVKGTNGANGTNGIDGVSVTGATVNGSGQLVLTLSSGATINAGVVKGTNGTNGVDGASASVTVGTTTTGAAGSNASVTNSGTAQNPVLNFTVPRGATGTSGTNGTNGTNGVDGAMGYKYTTGAVATGKFWIGTGVTDASGNVSFTLPVGYFTTVHSAQPIVIANNDNLYTSYVKTITATTVTVKVGKSNATLISLLGVNVLGLVQAEANVTVHLWVVGV